MEEASKQWNLIFDDDSFNIWQNSSPKIAMVQVMFHNLMKQLQILQKTFNEIFNEKGTTNMSQRILTQIERTPKKNIHNCEHAIETQIEENVDITDVDSPDIFKDTSVLSSSNMNTSDSIFNRNLLDSQSPVSDIGNVALPTFTSPTINRRKSCKKKKLLYLELNITKKNMTEDTISTDSSQTSLVDLNKNDVLIINPGRTETSKIKSSQKAIMSDCSPLSIPALKNTFQLPDLSRNRKPFQNFNNLSSNTTNDQQTSATRMEADEDATLIIGDADKYIDATLLVSCPIAKNVQPVNTDDLFLEMPNERIAKPIFLSKWEQRKLQENDIDEQNCSRCGNFRGVQDLSPTMCATKNYKCSKHRTKYIRLNTPEAIWNFNFPDEDGES